MDLLTKMVAEGISALHVLFNILVGSRTLLDKSVCMHMCVCGGTRDVSC